MLPLYFWVIVVVVEKWGVGKGCEDCQEGEDKVLQRETEGRG